MKLFLLLLFAVRWSGSVSPAGGVQNVALPANCAVTAQAAWDAAELQYTPMEQAASATQSGAGCAAWSLPPEYLTAGGFGL